MSSVRGRLRFKVLSIALALILGGGVVKTSGYIAFGSKAVLVDALTSVAAALGGFIVLVTMRISLSPPDIDHPYGHERIAYGGALGVLIAYSIAAGAAIVSIGPPEPYTIDSRASITAIIGTALYVAAIILARIDPVGGSVLAVFTWSEVFEGLVSAAAAYAGASLSYIIDYVGGLAILAYLLASLYRESKGLTLKISDITEKDVTIKVRKLLESRKFKVKSLRVRTIIPGRYAGDAIIIAPRGTSLEAANILVDEITEALLKENIDLVVHIDLETAEQPA